MTSAELGSPGGDARFRAVVESAPNAVIMIDAHGLMVLVNAQTERLFGYPRQELLQQPVDMLVPPRFRRDHAALRLQFDQAPHSRLMGSRPGLVGCRKDGSEVPLEIGLNPIETEAGPAVLATVIDITDRKQAEEFMLHLASIVGSSSDAIISKSLEGTILSWNAGAEAMYGYSAREAIGQPIAMLVPSDRSDDLPFILNKLRGQERVENYETVRVRQDGRRVLVSLTISPIRDASGQLIAASTIARDITDLRRAQDRFRVVVESAPNALVMVDGEGRIVLVNTQTESLFGYARSELLGQSIDLLLPVRYRAGHSELQKAYRTLPKSRPMGAGRELFGRRKDGREVAVEVGLSPLETAEGSFVLAAVVDITERKRAAADLAHKTEEVEAFVYTVSHDLRAPLVNLQGFSRELELSCEELRKCLERVAVPADVEPRLQHLLQADIPDSLRYIAASTTKFERLINALLGLSRSGRQEYRMEMTDVQAVVLSTLDTLRQSIVQSAAVLTVAELPRAWADATAVGQIFSNLVTNALHYLDPTRAGRIDIGGRSEADWSHYWVQDNGLGIPEAARSRLFLVFQRFHPDVAPGDGMGLATIKRIVERHGGKIWFESTEGGGTTFHFLLPATAREVHRGATPPA